MRGIRTFSLVLVGMLAGTGCLSSPETETAGVTATALTTPVNDVVEMATSSTSMGAATAGSSSTGTVEVTSDNTDSETIPNNATVTPNAGPQLDPDTGNDADDSSNEPVATEAPEEFFGDVDGDGRITGDDVESLLVLYGVTGEEDGDLNDDGRVDLTDIAILLSLID